MYNTIAGGDIGGVSSATGNAIAKNAMDGLLTTKCYNAKSSSAGGAGMDTGFVVIPSARKATVACALLFATGNDESDRDPFTVTLEGSNKTDINQLKSGSSWTRIYNGPTGINAMTVQDRSKYARQQDFSNEIAFISYRLLVTSKRNTSTRVQYSKAHILDCS